MKTVRTILPALMLTALGFSHCDKDDGASPKDDTPKANITINATDITPRGLDTLYVAPNDSLLIQAATIAPQNPPAYTFTSGDAAVLRVAPDPADSSRAWIVAAGDSAAVTTMTVNDAANGQARTLTAKVAVWADMNKFVYVASLNKHHYFIGKTVLDWAAARTLCERNRGHLATVTSAEENAVVKQCRIAAGREVWLGLFYTKDLTKWTQWVTGEAVGYKNWDAGYPQNPDDWDKLIFLYMTAAGKWRNQRNMVYLYVLEIE